MLGLVQHVCSRIDTGKSAKVMNKMRLIEVAAGERDVSPVNLTRVVNQFQHTLETAHAAERLGSKADCLTEALYESALAESDLVAHDRHSGQVRNVMKVAQRKRDRRMRRRLLQLQQQSIFKNAELLFRCCCFEQLIAHIVGDRGSP